MRFLLPLAVIFAACQPAAPSHVPGQMKATGEVVLTIDGEPLTQDVLDVIESQIPAQQLDMMKQMGQYNQFVEQMAVSQVLYKKAMAAGLADTPEGKLRLAMAERDALAKLLVDQEIEKATSDEALRAAYDERKVRFATPQVNARHILVETEEEANAIVARIKGGEDFAAIAKAESKDKGSGADGGNLNWFTKEQMVGPFAEAAFAAAKGEVVGPVQTQFGFHIIEVLDTRDSQPFEEVKDQLRPELEQEALRTFLEETQKASTVVWAGEEAASAEAPKADAGAPAGDVH